MHLENYFSMTGEYIQYQTLNYLPYGEDWVDIQHNLDPSLIQYRFNGKEKDYESGFHYYGARYYWSELLTGWLSVDPMMDKYPSISPYAYCVWNPVVLFDPDGEDPIYGKVLGKVSLIGDDGQNKGKAYYVTGSVKIKVILANLFGAKYSGLLAPSENVFHVPTGGVADDVQKTIDMVTASGDHPDNQVEYGAHSNMGANNAIIWDQEEPMMVDDNGAKIWSITPFVQDGKYAGGNAPDVEFVWHVQPITSNPSAADKNAAFNCTYNGDMKNATWFVVGAKDRKVTFFSGQGKCHTIDMEEFKKMSRQEKIGME